MATITVTMTLPDEHVADGWYGNTEELALTIAATLHELNADDGGVYPPTVTDVMVTMSEGGFAVHHLTS